MKKGICYGVSVGPGQENEITVNALKIIEEADCIFLPSFPKEECRAYIIIKKSMANIDEKELFCETFTMSRDVKVMQERHQEIFERTARLLDEGKRVAFLTLGEVGLYSTYLYIHDKLINAGYESKLISGISSVQAISDGLGIPLAIGNEDLHIFSSTDNLESKLATTGTKIFMKLKGDYTGVIATIQDFMAKNPGAEAYGISNYGMDGEVIADSADKLNLLSGYFTVIIVKSDLNLLENGSDYFENRSCSYYPCHKGDEHINCLFCYCPMYTFDNCLGNPSYKDKNGKRIKVCTNCSFPHQRENYGKIMKFLSEH